jgi:thiamine kinase-like enzyme
MSGRVVPRLRVHGAPSRVRTVDTDPKLEAAIRAVPEWAGHDIGLTPITAGITNRNFLIEVNAEAFVLRLAGQDTELLGIDRANEYAAGRAAAAAGVGPEVFAYLPQHECLITRFVAGAHIPEKDLQKEDVLASVVGSVRALHACPAIPSSFPVFRIVENYARLAGERGIAVPPAYDQAHAQAAVVETVFARAPMTEVPCHDDLLNANFLLDGDHTWIVDYEYAGMGDPFFDLGNLSINNGFPDATQEALLRLYFGTPNDGHRARLALMRIMSDFREAMWGVVQQAISTLDVDYVDYADRHFTRLLSNASDARFGAWLEAAGAPL